MERASNSLLFSDRFSRSVVALKQKEYEQNTNSALYGRDRFECVENLTAFMMQEQPANLLR